MENEKKLLIKHLAPWWGIGLTIAFLIISIVKFYIKLQPQPPAKGQVQHVETKSVEWQPQSKSR